MEYKNLKLQYLFKPKYSAADVFTPTTAAKLTFVNRESIEEDFKKSLTIPGVQMIIYGHSGSGKTTLIQNILKEEKRNFISTSCITGTTVNDLILSAFDKLNVYYKSNDETKDTTKIKSDLKASYSLIESALSSELSKEHTEKYQRVLPIQLTPQRLSEFLGHAECIWVIEDFHKVIEEEKTKLSQIMKVFVDNANTYKLTKIIAIGAVGSARDVVNYDRELNSRVSEIYVPLLNETELQEIITKGCKLLNINFTYGLQKGIVKYSNSLASICHHLCFNICFKNGIKRTKIFSKSFENDKLDDSVAAYVKQNSDSFKEILDNVLRQRKGKFENVKLILKSIIDLKKEQVTYNEILTKIQEKQRDYPQGNLTTYLKPLTTSEDEEILRYDTASGKYSFSNPFFKAYVMMTFEQDFKTEEELNKIYYSVDEIMEMLRDVV